MADTNVTDQKATEQSDETRTAFFYGTLMEPQVFFSVCYQTPKPPPALAAHHTFTPAVLHGFTRRRVRAADYPGMTPDTDPNASVFGMLVDNLTSANLQKLDWFEGAQYDRRGVRPRALTTVGDEAGKGNVEGEEVQAETYVFVDEKELQDREWDFAEFKREKLRSWTRGGIGFEECDPEDKATVAGSAV